MILLRTAAAGKAAQEDWPFVVLAEVASRHGLSILPLEAPCLSDGEIHLLARLAACQRMADTSAGLVPRDLRSAVTACAEALASRAVGRIPYHAIARAHCVEPAEPTARAAALRGHAIRAVAPARSAARGRRASHVKGLAAG